MKIDDGRSSCRVYRLWLSNSVDVIGYFANCEIYSLLIQRDVDSL